MELYKPTEQFIVHCGSAVDVLKTLPAESVQCCITSPPYYGLRDYGMAEQIGLEETPDQYIEKLVEVFREVRRVLRDDGTLWVNIGDTYGTGAPTSRLGPNRDGLPGGTEIKSNGNKLVPGMKPKDLIGIPWMLAFALRKDGWYLRSEIIWHKPNPMPESVRDRPTKAHEQIFLLSKSPKYYYDADAIREPNVYAEHHAKDHTKTSKRKENNKNKDNLAGNNGGQRGLMNEINPLGKNRRSVWQITPKPCKDAHFAVFPPELPQMCLLAGTSEKGSCIACGASIKRILEHPGNPEGILGYRGVPNAQTKSGGFQSNEVKINNPLSVRLKPGHNPTQYSKTQTVGWKPSCTCENEIVVPCAILDPFSGSGTTGIVANKHGRSYIGIELNPEYVEITKKRYEKEFGGSQATLEALFD